MATFSGIILQQGPCDQGATTTYALIPGSEVNITSVVIDPLGSYTGECTNTNEPWEFRYEMFCNGAKCGESTECNLCVDCLAEDLQLPEGVYNGNITSQVLRCGPTTEFVITSHTGLISDPQLNQLDGSFFVSPDFTTCGAWSFTYDLMCDGEVCTSATVSGSCPFFICNDYNISISGGDEGWDETLPPAPEDAEINIGFNSISQHDQLIVYVNGIAVIDTGCTSMYGDAGCDVNGYGCSGSCTSYTEFGNARYFNNYSIIDPCNAYVSQIPGIQGATCVFLLSATTGIPWCLGDDNRCFGSSSPGPCGRCSYCRMESRSRGGYATSNAACGPWCDPLWDPSCYFDPTPASCTAGSCSGDICSPGSSIANDPVCTHNWNAETEEWFPNVRYMNRSWNPTNCQITDVGPRNLSTDQSIHFQQTINIVAGDVVRVRVIPNCCTGSGNTVFGLTITCNECKFLCTSGLTSGVINAGNFTNLDDITLNSFSGINLTGSGTGNDPYTGTGIWNAQTSIQWTVNNANNFIYSIQPGCPNASCNLPCRWLKLTVNGVTYRQMNSPFWNPIGTWTGVIWAEPGDVIRLEPQYSSAPSWYCTDFPVGGFNCHANCSDCSSACPFGDCNTTASCPTAPVVMNGFANVNYFYSAPRGVTPICFPTCTGEDPQIISDTPGITWEIADALSIINDRYFGTEGDIIITGVPDTPESGQFMLSYTCCGEVIPFMIGCWGPDYQDNCNPGGLLGDNCLAGGFCLPSQIGEGNLECCNGSECYEPSTHCCNPADGVQPFSNLNCGSGCSPCPLDHICCNNECVPIVGIPDQNSAICAEDFPSGKGVYCQDFAFNCPVGQEPCFETQNGTACICVPEETNPGEGRYCDSNCIGFKIDPCGGQTPCFDFCTVPSGDCCPNNTTCCGSPTVCCPGGTSCCGNGNCCGSNESCCSGTCVDNTCPVGQYFTCSGCRTPIPVPPSPPSPPAPPPSPPSPKPPDQG